MSSTRVTSTAIGFTTALLAWVLSRRALGWLSTTGSSEIARACASAIGAVGDGMRRSPAATPRSYECPNCATKDDGPRTYTVVPGHKICVSCRAAGKTVQTEGSDRLPIYDAQRSAALAHLQEAFLAFYERRKLHRNKLGYADPEDIGARQARKEARQLRDLEQAVGDVD